MKSKLGVAVGVAYMLLGVSLAVYPEWFLSTTDWGSLQGLLAASAIRVVVGLVLWAAAPTSKYPKTLKALGAIALVGGLMLPFVPLDFWAEYMRWWIIERPSLFRWVLATTATLFGTFIAYAAQSRRVST